MKRIVTGTVCLGLLLALMPTAYAVGTSASSAILMEASSGRVLYEHNSSDRRLIASTTKLMTALTALNSGCELQDVVCVPKEAVGVDGSSLYLREGEEITLEALLYGMLLHSGNDAAIAVALHCAGSVEQFVADMNQNAARLGMQNTHFENPNGLDGPEHYSSALDMALLARACLEQETLAAMLSTRTIHIGGRSLTNHNKLLWRYDGCIGLKTGYTEKAGRTLVSAAQRDGMTLIAVTLNDPDDWSDHAALFDWGFSNFTNVQLVQKGTNVGRVPVQGALIPFLDAAAQEDFYYPLCDRDTVSLCPEWTERQLAAPVTQGQVLGQLNILCGGQPVASVPLAAAHDMPCARIQTQGILKRIQTLLS